MPFADPGDSNSSTLRLRRAAGAYVCNYTLVTLHVALAKGTWYEPYRTGTAA